jgi:hypothetical protein
VLDGAERQSFIGIALTAGAVRCSSMCGVNTERLWGLG